MHVGFIYNKPSFKSRRKQLRKDATPAERKVWNIIRNRKVVGFKFFRQYSVGYYILDFYCPELRLALEVDGGHHTSPIQKQYDIDRTFYLNNLDIQVVRFWNNEVMSNPEGVYQAIHAHLRNSSWPPLS